jgi:pimeloyl-ACP methyl ester carboxylesterase
LTLDDVQRHGCHAERRWHARDRADLRGCGESDKPEAVEEYAVARSVADMVAILDTLGIDRAHVVGTTLGAVVAWVLAALLPDRVDHLVAMSVGHPATARLRTMEDREKAWYQLLFQFPDVAEALLQRDDGSCFANGLEKMATSSSTSTILSRPGALTAGLNWYRANLAPQLELQRRTPPPAVAAPTLGLWSSGDNYLSEHRMIRSREHVIGRWRYEHIEGASQWMQIDEPDRVNEPLLEFLGARDGPR